MSFKKSLLTALAIASIASIASISSNLYAQTLEVKDAWARASVQGQKATGAFMKLSAKDGATLIGASSPVAGVVEVHEMKMEGDVMKMRAVPALALPPGKTVELKPGGYHVMLLDLKIALKKDSSVPLTLLFKDAKGVPGKLDIMLPVATQAKPQAGAHQH